MKKQTNDTLIWQSEISNSLKLLKEFEEEEWVTKSNEKIKIKNLSISHLKNIVKYLKKRYDAIESPMNDYPSFQGEMAQDYAEQQWNYEMARYRQMERTLKLFKVYYELKILAL